VIRFIARLVSRVWGSTASSGRRPGGGPLAHGVPAALRSETLVLPRPPLAPTARPWYDPIDGTSTPLVRPYLTAYEHEEKARLQRLRRDTLWCATYDVDLDTRDIHAVLGAAS
jgi:hypothetical protein